MKLAKVVKLPVVLINSEESEFDKDIWDIHNIGLETPKGTYSHTCNFTKISQPWLREASKRFIKYTLATLSVGTSLQRLSHMNLFSAFLAELNPKITPSDINRPLAIEYLNYLANKNLSVSTRNVSISAIKSFLELCVREGWLSITDKPLFHKEDYPRRNKAVPRYIPQEVVIQLNQHLDCLPSPLMRMILVHQECGMRVSELCYLKFSCLLQDVHGDWFVKYNQSKMKKEVTIPISKELVAVIQEQQKYIRQNFGNAYSYLFCRNSPIHLTNGLSVKERSILNGYFYPVAKPPTRERYNKLLNQLAKAKNVCDLSGNVWHFQSHQFRHSVGTRMINNGVPQHIVQRYLGHESPEMTAIYAHIHDQTLKKEITKFHGKVVNVAGQVVESENPELDITDLQWFKKNVLAQALPNGSCALPTITQGCPHANACLTCTHFRTTPEFLPEHKTQLEQTKEIIEKAKLNGWTRQVEMNEQIAVNLRSIIKGLEGQDAPA